MASVLLSVVTWNSATTIEACLRSALAQTYADFELWVVDNASTDDTRARVQALAATDARLRLHALPTNTGIGSGHHYALDHTATELVLLVSPAVAMAPDYLACAVAAMHHDPRIGTVCGLLQTTEPDPRSDSAGLVQQAGGRVAGADGALLLLRRRCLDDLRVEGGFFDQRFSSGEEAWDIARRSQPYGWRTVFEPACRALHPPPSPAAPAARPRLAGLRPVRVPPPLLTICMPTYHRPTLLARALRSIGPLPPDVEILVSDNSTANDLCGLVARLGLRHQPAGQWRYYRNAPGSTVADNFVACVRRARGHYLYHLHDDDFLQPGGLARLVAELRAARGQHEVLLFGVDVVDSHRRLMRRQQPARRRWLAPRPALTRVLTNSSWVRVPALVASRAAYLAHPADLAQEGTGDTDLWARFFSQWGVQLVPVGIAAYTVHEGALTASMFNEHNVELVLRIFAKAQAQGLLPAPALRRAQARFFNQFVLAGTYRSLRQGNYAAAHRVLQLFELPALRALPRPLRWLPARLALQAFTWLATLAPGAPAPAPAGA